MILLRLLAIAVSAATFGKPGRCDPGQLRHELEAKGFVVSLVQWSPGLGCQVVLDRKETKNPKAIMKADVYVDPMTAMANEAKARKERAAYLLQGLVAGTLTAAEKDELATLISRP